MEFIEGIAFFIHGIASLLTAFAQIVAAVLFWAAVLVVYPMSISKQCRAACGWILFLISLFFYFYLWLHCVTTSFYVAHWGIALTGVVTIIGSIPVAVIGSITDGSWVQVGGYTAGLLVAWFFQYSGERLLVSSER